MNIETLLKLEKNPHYKLNDKQKEMLLRYRQGISIERQPMVEFGVPNIHNSLFQQHPTVLVKRKRK